MSHFSVVVITRNHPEMTQEIEHMMAPYDEDRDCIPYVKETKEQYVKRRRKELDSYKNTRYAQYLQDPKAYEEQHSRKPEHVLYVKNFMDEYNKSDEELIAKWHATYPKWNEERKYGQSFINENGDLVTFINKDGKYDYYSSFKGLPKKDGTLHKTLQIRDIDFGIDTDLAEKANDPAIIEEYKKLTETDGTYLPPEHYKMYYPTIEDYIIDKSYFSTYAVIDVDGVWHSPGEVGWFGMSSETPEEAIKWTKEYYEKFFKNINGDYFATIIDCHI